jgi:hypothetical protein
MDGGSWTAVGATEFVTEALKEKPDLIVHVGDVPATARAVRDLLAASGQLYDRGVPVKVRLSADGEPPIAVPLRASNVVMEVHSLCQPVSIQQDGRRLPATLSDRASPELALALFSGLTARCGPLRDMIHRPASGAWLHRICGYRSALSGERLKRH